MAKRCQNTRGGIQGQPCEAQAALYLAKHSAEVVIFPGTRVRYFEINISSPEFSLCTGRTATVRRTPTSLRIIRGAVSFRAYAYCGRCRAISLRYWVSNAASIS